MASLLIVSGNPREFQDAARLLEQRGHAVHKARNLLEVTQACTREAVDLVLFADSLDAHLRARLLSVLQADCRDALTVEVTSRRDPHSALAVQLPADLTAEALASAICQLLDPRERKAI